MHMRAEFAVSRLHRAALIVLTLLIVTAFTWHQRNISAVPVLANTRPQKCVNPDYYRPKTYNSNKLVLEKILRDETFRNESALKLQKAVQVDTQIADDLPYEVEADPGFWKRFDAFEQFLEDTFPLFYANVELHKVNHYGLVYTWKGSDNLLKPLVLMAHQDVVPVSNETLSEWDYPPFEGHYNGTYMHGRGVADIKNLLVGLLEAAEELIKVGFKPKRSIIYSFGFDEEVMGTRNKNAKYIESVLGKNSVYAILDEGGTSVGLFEGVTMAVPATAEKGYMTVKISVDTPGGHSSIPPDWTGIGIMGELITHIEENPFQTHFTEDNPVYWQYLCIAENSDTMDPQLREDILDSQTSSKANERVRLHFNAERGTSYAIKTTQALDVINGGSKANSLPEHVELTINARFPVEESVDSVMAKFVEDARSVASEHGLGVVLEKAGDPRRTILDGRENRGDILVATYEFFEASPATPIGDSQWGILGGTIRHVYEELVWPEKYVLGDAQPIIVSSGIAPGNTDTKYYWNLTNHIYRYRPGEIPSILSRSHSINEYIKFDSHLQIIAFYFEFIQSVDEDETE